MGKKKRYIKRVAVEKRKDKVRVKVEEDLKKISNQDLYSSEITGILSDVPKILYEKMSPMLEIQDALYEKMNPMLEMQDALYEKMSPMLEIQDALHEKMNPMLEMQQIWHEKMSPMLEIQDALYEKMSPIIEMYNKIDWDLLRETVAEEIKELEAILVEQEESYWCLDIGTATAIVNGEITKDDLSEYMDENLEPNITKIVQDPIYELHATLIQETYEAYKAGFYKLCAMPLFAAFEHVVKLWCFGYIKKDNIVVNHKPDRYGIKKQMDPENYNHVEKENLNKIFALSVFRMYEKIFAKIPEQLGQELNRNAIAHGFHDYNSLSKVDIQKLFQLLKATLILKSFEPNKVAES
ncbi:hypothetical protein [Bacillus wiedmannii]|uniref:hypothetical protein n=1 Tax=Bacillus wiedmannii TaxID=1890302 RepID=UPI0020D26AF5|nr:hypothetical protein [Bacillus wiedmannii]